MGLHVLSGISNQHLHNIKEGVLMVDEDLVDSGLHEAHEVIKLLLEEGVALVRKEWSDDLCSY